MLLSTMHVWQPRLRMAPWLLLCMLVAWPMRAEAAFSIWAKCPAVLADPAAQLARLPKDLCTNHVFVREHGTAEAPDMLHLVNHHSTIFRLRDGQPLVFLDLDGSVPTLHFAVTSGRASLADMMGLLQVKRLTGDRLDLPAPSLGALVQQTLVDLLVDVRLLALEKRLGLYFGVDDGLNVFSSMGVASVPEFNVVFFSAVLTEEGRRFFEALVKQGIAGMDSVLQWRVRHLFGEDVVVPSTGVFPCVKAGRRTTSAEELRTMDPRLLKLPVQFNNMVQLVNCQ